ncbi:MAG: class I SAM-dependent methyltransferase [Alistipes sp.]|nr:class I SAM-dependent methyltransferase [Candidatus Alistipes equi]
MNCTPQFEDYKLIDSGDGEKLERFGRFVLRRPEPQAVWHKSLSEKEWLSADASFLRESGSEERGEWKVRSGMPDRWNVQYKYKTMSLKLRLALTSFKHVGLFPEQAENWNFIFDACAGICAPKVLNLFAYTGGASLAAASAGAQVTHVDSVKQVLSWSSENASQSGIEGIRWIHDDALKFAHREQRRGNRYQGIILDPPAYGRGANGEKWVLEQNIAELMECLSSLLEKENSFLVLNLYSMGLSSTIARTLVHQFFPNIKKEEFGELCFDDLSQKRLPLGTFYRMYT